MNEEIPVEHTDHAKCPDCGVRMNPSDPTDPWYSIWYCTECGFNEPEDDTGA